MRIVLDSSVLIAAAITRAGVCAEVLEDVLSHHTLVMSDFILGEVDRKLRTKFQFHDRDVRALLHFLKQQSQHVDPAPVPVSACRDPKDRPILGTGVAGSAELLISGDRDLLILESYEGIAIRRPADFWQFTTR